MVPSLRDSWRTLYPAGSPVLLSWLCLIREAIKLAPSHRQQPGLFVTTPLQVQDLITPASYSGDIQISSGLISRLRLVDIMCGSRDSETKVHPKVRNHGESPYWGLLLVESGYYRFHN